MIASRLDTNPFKSLPRLSQRTLLYSGRSVYALSASCRRDLNCLWINEERETMKLTMLITVFITEFKHSDDIFAHKLSWCIMQWKLNTWRPIWSCRSLTNPLFFPTRGGINSNTEYFIYVNVLIFEIAYKCSYNVAPLTVPPRVIKQRSSS